MNILVMGAGAIGSVFGGLLAKAGHDVTLVGRNPHMKAVLRHGLHITGLWGRHVAAIRRARTRPPARCSVPYGLILITVKAHDTVNAARTVRHLAGPDTFVLSLQNGLNNYEKLREHIAADRIIIGRVIFGVHLERPGQVNVTVCADKVRIGHPENAVRQSKIDEIAEMIAQAGIPASSTTEIVKYIWDKVLYNCALNPLSALLDCTYGRLLESDWTRDSMFKIVEEIYDVAGRLKIELFKLRPRDYIDELFKRLIPRTASHRSSMLQDLTNGKRSEIDALNGAIVELSGQAGCPAPVNAMLTSLIKAKEDLGPERIRTRKSPLRRLSSIRS